MKDGLGVLLAARKLWLYFGEEGRLCLLRRFEGIIFEYARVHQIHDVERCNLSLSTDFFKLDLTPFDRQPMRRIRESNKHLVSWMSTDIEKG